MDDKKQSGATPEQNGVGESTKGFPIVSKEDADNAAAFEMKKKTKDGNWETAIPVNVTGGDVVEPETAAPEKPEAAADASDDKTMKIAAVKIDDEAEQPKEPPRRAAQEETQPFEPIAQTDGGSGNGKKPRAERKSGGMGKRIAAVIAGVVVVAVVALSVYTYTYGKIFPGVKVADEYKLSGMTQEQAASYISSDVQNGVLEQIGRMRVQDGFSDGDCIYIANLAADAVNGGFTSREVERTIRAIRLAFKAKDAHTDDPYYADLAARAVDMLRRMAAYETKGAAND